MAFVYRHLVQRFPGRYRLLMAPDLYRVLNEGGYGLDELDGVHVLPPSSRLDRKRGAHASLLVNLGRLVTLMRDRAHIKRWARAQGVEVVQVYLELVPFLGVLPLAETPMIVSLVSHLPWYFDRSGFAGRALRRGVDHSLKADCLYLPIVDGLRQLGVDEAKLNWPFRNTTNHERFHPEPKEQLISFTARAIRWKNPHLMASAIARVLQRYPSARFAVLGRGPLQEGLRQVVQREGWQERVLVDFRADPSDIVNRSLIHVSIEEFDNAPNQSLLEAMAAGCAVVASDVGLTREEVTSDVGLLTSLDPADVADRIIDLLGRPQAAEALGREGRKRILRDHHVDRYVEYLDLLHDFSRPDPVRDGRRLVS
jgi:glycosyltransferase involved in cell wall biosynthesis